MSTESLICYNRLWKLMVDKNINKTQLKLTFTGIKAIRNIMEEELGK